MFILQRIVQKCRILEILLSEKMKVQTFLNDVKIPMMLKSKFYTKPQIDECIVIIDYVMKLQSRG